MSAAVSTNRLNYSWNTAGGRDEACSDGPRWCDDGFFIDIREAHIHNLRLSNAPVAQLDRVPGYEPGGREFESLRARHLPGC
jgi:hypothetical protein